MTVKETQSNSANWDAWWSLKFYQYGHIHYVWYGFLWRAYKRLLQRTSLSSESHVLEVGCGSGEMSSRIAKRFGCSITVVDKSETAIALAAECFRQHNVRADLVHGDIFDLKYREQFDLVHSEGLLEHFDEAEMTTLIRLHAEASREGGYVLTFVPTDSFFYAISTWLMKATSNWYFGYEVPVPERQHVELYHQAGLTILGHTRVLFREFGLIGQKGVAREHLCNKNFTS